MSYDKEFLEKIILNSLSIAQVCRELNLRPSGGNYKKIKSLVKIFNIDISHFTGQGWNKNNRFNLLRQKYSIEDILTNKVTYTSSTRLRQRLILEGYKENKCEKCDLSKWMNKQIPLELNHINGDNLDNRIENLEILCCNCHAQTDNWRGKNKNKSSKLSMGLDNYNNYKDLIIKKEKVKKEKPNCARCGNKCLKGSYKYCSQECYKEDIKEFKKVPKVPELLEAFKIYKNFLQVGKFFNVSDNAVRKWCKNYGILEIVSKKNVIFEL
jgi:hypothetical protein